MYKVFLNDREIVIAQPANQTMFQYFDVFENIHTTNEVKDWFEMFVYKSEGSALLLHNNPDEFMKFVFCPAFTQIEAAGGVVIRYNQILFIYRNGKWDLPKGKLDTGETPEAAGIREVEEECGIQGHKIAKSLPPTFHIYQSTWESTAGEWILKKTHWFEMKYSGFENGNPETDENITEIRWIEKGELGFVLENTYGNLKSIINRYN